MKTALASKFGRVSPSMKPVILRTLYRELTNDASAPTNLHEAEINARLMRDLRHLNSGTKTWYDVFWSECKKFLDEVIGSPVDDRKCHTISACDLREQVQAKCPDGTPIPSESWICLQFWLKT